MNILVTGATGFVGRHVVPLLLHRGHHVTALARDEGKAKTFEWYSRVVFHSHLIGEAHPGFIRRLGDQNAVIHLAWSGLPDYKAIFHLEHNLPAHRRFLGALVEEGIHQVLVTGTCFEYGMKSGCLSEDLPTDPVTAYGRAKDALRLSLEALQRRTPFVLQWARLFYLYGSGQNSRSLIPQLDQALDRNEQTFDMSGGEQLRDYLPVTEAARRLVRVVESPELAGLINICSGTPISVRALVEARVAERGASIRLNLGHYPYPEYEPMAFWGDTAKYTRYMQSDHEGSHESTT